MAAYLVGSRGSARHALALGATVTVSHTLGVLALALVTLFAANIVPPERLYPILGVGSGVLVIGIGLWLLYGRYRIWRATRAHAAMHAGSEDEQVDGHVHADGHTDAHAPVPALASGARSYGMAHAGLAPAVVMQGGGTVDARGPVVSMTATPRTNATSRPM